MELMDAFREKQRLMAVLNFANPSKPGGGVTRGADAREEYLCRASNPYPCLVSPNAAAFHAVFDNFPPRREGVFPEA